MAAAISPEPIRTTRRVRNRAVPETVINKPKAHARPAKPEPTPATVVTVEVKPNAAKVTAALAQANDKPLCRCGCGERTGGGLFRSGHDSRWYSALAKAVGVSVDELKARVKAEPERVDR